MAYFCIKKQLIAVLFTTVSRTYI